MIKRVDKLLIVNMCVVACSCIVVRVSSHYIKTRPIFSEAIGGQRQLNT